jgi:hypothetical protein
MMESFAAVHESGSGPSRQILRCNRMSAFGGIAEVAGRPAHKRQSLIGSIIFSLPFPHSCIRAFTSTGPLILRPSGEAARTFVQAAV